MSEILGVSAVVILAILIFASWLTNSKLLKLITVLFIFLYPAMIGQVKFPEPNTDSIINYVGDVLRYWLSEVWQQIWNFIQHRLFSLQEGLVVFHANSSVIPISH